MPVVAACSANTCSHKRVVLIRVAIRRNVLARIVLILVAISTYCANTCSHPPVVERQAYVLARIVLIRVAIRRNVLARIVLILVAIRLSLNDRHTY